MHKVTFQMTSVLIVDHFNYIKILEFSFSRNSSFSESQLSVLFLKYKYDLLVQQTQS